MPLWLGWTLALLVAAGFARLGFWQLARMHEKEALLASVQAVLAQRVPRPLALAGDASRAGEIDWATGRGRFADAPAVLLDNQSRNDRPRRARVSRVPARCRGRGAVAGRTGLAAVAGRPRDAAGRADPRRHRRARPVVAAAFARLVAATANRASADAVLATALDAPQLPRCSANARSRARAAPRPIDEKHRLHPRPRRAAEHAAAFAPPRLRGAVVRARRRGAGHRRRAHFPETRA